MKIEKSYGRTVNLGNYESARIDLKIKCEKEIKSKDELEKVSGELLKLAKSIVDKESEKMKEERNEE